MLHTEDFPLPLSPKLRCNRQRIVTFLSSCEFNAAGGGFPAVSETQRIECCWIYFRNAFFIFPSKVQEQKFVLRNVIMSFN